MKVGILGNGEVAQALAKGFEGRGDSVMLSSRDPKKAPSFAQAAAFGEIVVIATHGDSTVELLKSLDPKAFAGKTVIDATNPVRSDETGYHLTVGFSDSLGEQVQRALPGAHVVKAFNTVGADLMIKPAFAGGPGDMFIAGNDDGARAQVAAIVTSFGWNPVDMGGIESARHLEAMCMVWVIYGVRTNTFNHGFKFLHTA